MLFSKDLFFLRLTACYRDKHDIFLLFDRKKQNVRKM